MSLPIESPFRHECILASAGSGKTFRLASHYLALLRAGASVESILATTFTRAAAGEIERRILLWLVDAANSAKVRTQLAEHTGGGTLERHDVVALLRRLVDDLDRLEVRTIDSFFGGIVNGFGLEMGLAPGMTVADDTAEQGLRREAIETMLRVVGDDLMPILRRMSEGAADRKVYGAIESSIMALYDLSREASPEAWAVVTIPAPIADEEARLLAFVAFEPEPKGFAKPHAKAVAGVKEGNLNALIDGGLGAKIVAGDTTFSRKEIDENTITIYQRAIEVLQVEAATTWQNRAHGVADMLGLYGHCLDAVKRKRRAMTFSDVPHLLVRADIAGRLDEVRYRLDGAIDHLELDEFQDTSPIQWQLLRPMAEELIVAEDARPTSFFCVGDVKQSIYRWRSACPEILESVPNLLTDEGEAGPVTRITMDHSYRSAPPVIDAVNTVFESIGSNPSLKDEPVAAEDWGAAFTAHTTERERESGRVELRVVRGSNGSFKYSREQKNRKSFRVEAAADLVAELLERGPGLTIGVLARSNLMVGMLLHAMGPSERDLPVSGRGGTPLTDTPAVNAILALLQVASHPGDSAAAFHVAESPLGVAIGFDAWDEAPARSALGRRVRRELQERGPVAVTQGWANAVASDVDPRSWHRLEQLVDLAAQAEALGVVDAAALLQRVETQRAAEPRPAPIQIMTIHQSKGLEFEAVVLADLNVSLVGHLNSMVERENNVGPICRIAPPASADRAIVLPELESLYRSERAGRTRETLCTLYVAMTRARHGLYMLVDPLSSKPGLNVASVVTSALKPKEIAPDPETGLVYAGGDPDWMTSFVSAAPEPAGTSGVHFTPPPAGRVRARRQLSASALGSAEQPLAQRLQLGDERPRWIGTAAHAILEQIVWLDGDAPDEARQRDWIRRAVPRLDDEGHEAVLAMVAAALEQPAFRGLLEPPDGPRPQVEGEWEYIAVDDDGMSSGSIDRLVLHGPPEQPVRAEVIDYKTDNVTLEQTVERAGHHRPQLERYRAEVVRQFGLEPSEVSMTVAFVRSGAVVSLESH